MIKAKQHNVVCKPIPQTKIENQIITVDENNPYYLEVVSVGPKVEDIEVGDYVYAVGDPVVHRVEEQLYLVVTSSQVKFSVDKEDL